MVWCIIIYVNGDYDFEVLYVKHVFCCSAYNNILLIVIILLLYYSSLPIYSVYFCLPYYIIYSVFPYIWIYYMSSGFGEWNALMICDDLYYYPSHHYCHILMFTILWHIVESPLGDKDIWFIMILYVLPPLHCCPHMLCVFFVSEGRETIMYHMIWWEYVICPIWYYNTIHPPLSICQMCVYMILWVIIRSITYYVYIILYYVCCERRRDYVLYSSVL